MKKIGVDIFDIIIWLASSALVVYAIYGAYFGGRAYLGDWFVIPTSSMEPTLIPGDRIIVSKLVVGARIYDEFDFGVGVEMKSHRTHGLRKVKHNDVVVFNCPMNRARTKMEFEINYVYCKRCVALPGDSLSAQNGYFVNNNFEGVIGVENEQYRLSCIPDSLLNEGVKYVMPFDSELFDWTIKDFGPLYVPQKGAQIEIDYKNIKLYDRIIEFETGVKCDVSPENIVMHEGVELTNYTFKRDYYFMCGDNVLNSNDSRYWGFVPEEFIVGVATNIIFSRSKVTDQFRWNRFMKRLK